MASVFDCLDDQVFCFFYALAGAADDDYLTFVASFGNVDCAACLISHLTDLLTALADDKVVMFGGNGKEASCKGLIRDGFEDVFDISLRFEQIGFV